MKDFWNQRYSDDAFAYGTEPNVFFKDTLDGIAQSGSILMVAEGEGRNAVYASKKGWQVEAFDQSEEAQKKAFVLAASEGVALNYQVSTIENLAYTPASFDAVALIYAHFPHEKRKAYHQQLASYLKVGGVLILEGFDKQHAENQKNNPDVGGPGNIDMLFSIDELRNDFADFEFSTAEVVQTNLTEGLYHNGQACVVRIVAIRLR